MKYVFLFLALGFVIESRSNPIEQYEDLKFQIFSTENNSLKKIDPNYDTETVRESSSVGVAKPSPQETVLTPPQKIEVPKINLSKSSNKDTVENKSSLGFTKEENEEYDAVIKRVKDKYPQEKITDEYINEVFSEIEKVQNKNKTKLKQ